MKNQLADRYVEISSKNLYGKFAPVKHLSLSKPFGLIQSRPFSSSFKSKEKDSRNFASRILDHVKMGSKLSETVKGKLMIGSLIIQEGGTENVFKQRFGMREGEELLKSCQCYLSTTVGPIAGLLFISTEKVGFLSERPITANSPSGQSIRTHYKVLIPIRKIKRGYQRENVKRPAEKYIEVVTKDGYEFWFMGFLAYEKAFVNLQKALSLVGTKLSSDCRRGCFLIPATD